MIEVRIGSPNLFSSKAMLEVCYSIIIEGMSVVECNNLRPVASASFDYYVWLLH